MESALILVEVVTGCLVTTTVSVTMVKMPITAQRTVVATMMEYANLAEEKTNIHVSMIVDATLMGYVNLIEEKLLETAKIAPAEVREEIQEALIQLVAIIHALVVG